MSELKYIHGKEDVKILFLSNAVYAPCYDEKTEIHTGRGWLKFKDLVYDDEIATLNHETKTLEYQKPSQIIIQPYTGKMYSLEAKELSIRITPNHKHYVRKRGKTDFELLPIKDVYGLWDIEHYRGGCVWDGEDRQVIEIPKQGSKSGKVKTIGKVRTELFMEFLGWYLAEGSYSRGTKREYIVGLALNNKEGNRVLEICQKTFPMLKWFKVEEKHKTNLRTYSKELYHFVKPFGRSHQKYIPESIKGLNRIYLQLLIDALIDGDGAKRKRNNSRVLTTSSKRLRDDLMEIGIKCGYGALYYPHTKKGDKVYFKREDRYFEANHDTWRVSLTKGHLTPMPRKNKVKEEWIDNEGAYVYCVTVPNHLLLVRRNGKAYFSGNSGYGVQANGMLYDWIKQGYNVRQIAHYGLSGRMIGLNGLMIYPALEGDPHGDRTARLIFQNWKPDIFFTLYDIWMDAYTDGNPELPQSMKAIHPRWVAIVMVDHEPVPEKTVINARCAYKVVSPTRWGKAQLEAQGVSTEYIPFGIDTDVWRPSKGVKERKEDKKWLQERSVPFHPQRRAVIDEDSFVIHINGANKDPYRKGFMRAFIALQLFFQNNPDAEKDVRVYVHSWMKFARDLPHGARVMQVDWACKGSGDYHMLCGVPEDAMARIARSADLFIHPTQGGGFEIPVMEAMSCGVPVIASDFVGLPELVEKGGWLAKLKTHYMSPLDATQAIVDEHDLAAKIEKVYNMSERGRRRVGARGRKRVLREYRWEDVNRSYRELIDLAVEEMRYKPLEVRKI